MARTAVVAGTATAVSGKVARSQNARAEQQAAAQQEAAQQAAPQEAPPPAAASPGDDLIAQLERLGSLHSQGLLTDAEFAAAKSSLLS
jgi:hypothetical protein